MNKEEIPEEIKQKIGDLYTPVNRLDYRYETDYQIACSARQELRFAAEFGYSLASTQQCAAKDAEIERLEVELENVRLYFSLTEIEFDNIKIKKNGN